MSKPAPIFRQIAAPLDVSDDDLNTLGDKLGVPTMVRPEPPPAPKTDAPPEDLRARPTSLSGPPAMSRVEAKPRSLAQKQLNIAPLPSPVTEKITVELPFYLASALRREAAERRITARTLVMMGLQSLGFHVDEQDLIPDGRRVRSKRVP